MDASSFEIHSIHREKITSNQYTYQENNVYSNNCRFLLNKFLRVSNVIFFILFVG